ncbi:MAG: electron transfer flavoprotein-ubiquinone oxidoreductase [Methylotenera sp.]|uniref:electron transfer flavoprotein-ubiquinone oxidoreductase n=1 Tax=Methylotenera sp. TaxID=2051956 RepID=UPI002487FE3D|nr:electron transfer flavoprotein-ubiquinone oxidoreductase [Methylotenera sp.]MDI1310468.1 electron transfer flavoprotein-ubiquinone oxidoreductase [Methylotenera sp.]
MQRDVMNYDLLIVGAGPAGLSAAIKAKQLAIKSGKALSVCVIEKGAEIGAHIMSGAVLDPIALNELIPDWLEKGAPLNTKVTHDTFSFLSEQNSWEIPTPLMPPLMSNQGNYIISLGELCRWLALQAENLGVEIYAGFSGQTPLFNEAQQLIGIITGDMGRDEAGKETSNYVAGIEIHAKYTLIAEGTRGSLTKVIENTLNLRKKSQPQKYGLGFKEIWRIPASQHQPGLVQHSMGWPLKADTGGGAFIYHYGEHLLSVGFVVHLDYKNPHLSLFDEFQRFKTHPKMQALLKDGKRISYGARAISEGGMQSWQELIFAGGAFIGCSAGMVNVPRIKGIHNAMKSGMLAAEAAFDAILNIGDATSDKLLYAYPTEIRSSWLVRDLKAVRNVKPLISRFGGWVGVIMSGAELWLASFNLYLPWTLKHQMADHETLRKASEMPKIAYKKPDGIFSFDKSSSIHLSNISHEPNQPCHLQMKDLSVPIAINLREYDAPEQRYCPAGVYEIVIDKVDAKLQINAQNCIHCKTCDIKDPTQNINWVPPEGGSGPSYSKM